MQHEFSNIYINKTRMKSKLSRQYSVEHSTNDYPIKVDSLYEILSQKYPSKNARRHKSKGRYKKRHKTRESKQRQDNYNHDRMRNTIVPTLYSSSHRKNVDNNKQLGCIDCILKMLRENEFIQNICIPFFEPPKPKCKDVYEQTDQALLVERMPALSPELYIRQNATAIECDDRYSRFETPLITTEKATSVSQAKIIKENLHTQTNRHYKINEFSTKRCTPSEIRRLLKFLIPLYIEHHKKKQRLEEMKKQMHAKEYRQKWWKQSSEQNKQCQGNLPEIPQSMLYYSADYGDVTKTHANIKQNTKHEKRSSDKDCKKLTSRADTLCEEIKHEDKSGLDQNVQQQTKEMCKSNENISLRDERSNMKQNSPAVKAFYCTDNTSEELLSNGKYSYDKGCSKSTLSSIQGNNYCETQEKINQSSSQKLTKNKNNMNYKTTQCCQNCLSYKERWKRIKKKLHYLEQKAYRDFDECQCFQYNNFFALKPLRYTCHRYIYKKPKKCNDAKVKAHWNDVNSMCYHIWCDIGCCIAIVITIVIFIIYFTHICK